MQGVNAWLSSEDGRFRAPALSFGVSNYTAVIQAGGRSLVTSYVYGDAAQLMLADALSKLPLLGVRRADLFVTSMVGCQMPEGGKGGKDAAVEQARDSLRITGADFFDLMLLHYPCRTGPDSWDTDYTMQTVAALGVLVDEGVSRAIGVSNFHEPMLHGFEKAMAAGIFKFPPVLNQIGFAVGAHRYKESVVEHTRKLNMVPIAFSPLGGNICGHACSIDSLNHPVVVKLARAKGVHPSLVLLRWVLQRNVGILTSSKNPKHIASDLKVFELTLTADEMKLLSDVPELPPV